MCIRDRLSPVLYELAEEKSGAIKVGKINVDEQRELAMRFQVSSIPMLVVFKDGKAVAKSVGYRPKSEIAAMAVSYTHLERTRPFHNDGQSHFGVLCPFRVRSRMTRTEAVSL